MKKLIAMILCFAMVAAFGATAAFAAMPEPNSAYDNTEAARYYLDSAKNEIEFDKKVDKAVSILKAYEAVKYDSSKTKDQVDKAYDKAVEQIKALGLTCDPNVVTSADVSTWKLISISDYPYLADTFGDYDGWEWATVLNLFASKSDVWSAYWLSSGTKMDVNRRDITLAKLESAAQLGHAQSVAAAAKAGALKAQATAKVLIADSIKVAQDAAATAVANAQAAAYNTLAANYADAVEAFWGEVAAAWGF